MTRWERFYRWIGGGGPETPLVWSEKNDRYVTGWPSRFANFLMRFGFLRCDPALSDLTGSWYVNMRWQWRFWRGPYRDVLEARGIPVVSWWTVVTNRWYRERGRKL